jgi:hypothetical protein
VNYLATALLGLSQIEGCICRYCSVSGKLRSEKNVMIRNLLMIAVLSTAVGFAVSAAKAAPPTSMLETLKAGASEGNMVQEARYRFGKRKDGLEGT